MKRKSLLYIGNKLNHRSSTPTNIESLGSFLEQEGFVVKYASGVKNKFLRLAHMLAATVLYSKKANYVLIDTYSTTNFWYAVSVAKLCSFLKLRYIPILHGGNLPKRYKKSPLNSKKLLKNAHKSVAPSPFLFNFFIKEGYNNLVYIPNSIDLSIYNFKKRETFKPKLLWVRSFASIYNPLMALKVLEILLKNYPGATLCMVGPEKDGSLKTCQIYAKSRQLPVIFRGKLEKEEWVNLSVNYDIFINTTHYDNTPVSVIEAMALGLAVVSTNVGGIPFLLENDTDALLVDDDDTEAFAKAITILINDSIKSQMLAFNARRKVEKFDWEVVKKQWIELLN